MLPKAFDFSRFKLEDFENLTAHQFLYDKYYGQPKTFLLASGEMAKVAKAVNYSGFKQSLKTFVNIEEAARRRDLPSKVTEFSGQQLCLDCGQWDCNDHGIYRTGRFGVRECACSHPIMPVERMRNVDTGETRIRLAFCRERGCWNSIIVDPASIATARTIVPALANLDISVTGTTAAILVDFLNEISDRNRDVIPQSKSIGRLGYIQGEGFSPYVEGLVFDGDTSFKHLYETVRSRGSQTRWFDAALECRKMSVTARIMLAASFASPILSIVGALPFFVHLWGVDSGTGKTVALMLAASVWGDPTLGSYTQTFNATQVGQERVAAFLNHLPLCIDELQLTKDGHGRTNFDVYQLAQGVGRARGKRSGGIELTPTWGCCFLTTGESPIVSGAAGAGAVNRVIDIECNAGNAVITDGPRISSVLKQNYGFAGEIFVEKLYANDKTLEAVREIYSENFKELCAGDSTEKQAMAAAAIITADELATMWIFDDGMNLTPKDIQNFLASREAVSAGRRAYNWLCDWVASNVKRFASEGNTPTSDVYGKLEDGVAWVNRGIFNKALQDAGFSDRAILSYLRSNNLIETRPGKGYTVTKSIQGHITDCVCLRLGDPAWACDSPEIELLPL